jgi:hypothetical protein
MLRLHLRALCARGSIVGCEVPLHHAAQDTRVKASYLDRRLQYYTLNHLPTSLHVPDSYLMRSSRAGMRPLFRLFFRNSRPHPASATHCGHCRASCQGAILQSCQVAARYRQMRTPYCRHPGGGRGAQNLDHHSLFPTITLYSQLNASSPAHQPPIALLTALVPSSEPGCCPTR